ncbi:A24 family peptidase [Oceaniovalibus sp. ACAM 378]|uniref:prepilin peptidase n=1 Tax=Oceaniovalibus sp. ACAM 378 TaxID=2599923 RepID=UPI0011DB4C12|nr:A24 family peptidase [Oceaniovalibus sp. ACAM 378]TYB83768.1 prepilin peptidase [Oceaniovalibus sp. ACAM 378]
MTLSDLLHLPQGPVTAPDVWASPVLAAALIWLGFTDWRLHRLPDRATLPLIVAGLALAAWRDQSVPWAALIGAGVAFALFAAIGAVYFRSRGVDGLGLGDAKLLAGAGAWLGWQSLPGVVLIAALTGLATALVLGRRGTTGLPFGPAIAVAFFLHWLVFVGAAS